MNTKLIIKELEAIKSDSLATAHRCDRALKAIKQVPEVKKSPVEVRLDKRALKFLKTK